MRSHGKQNVTFNLAVYTCFGAPLEREVGKGSSIKSAVDAAVARVRDRASRQQLDLSNRPAGGSITMRRRSRSISLTIARHHRHHASVDDQHVAAPGSARRARPFRTPCRLCRAPRSRRDRRRDTRPRSSVTLVARRVEQRAGIGLARSSRRRRPRCESGAGPYAAEPRRCERRRRVAARAAQSDSRRKDGATRAGRVAFQLSANAEDSGDSADGNLVTSRSSPSPAHPRRPRRLLRVSRMSTATRPSAVARTTVRSACATRPLRPITFPRSSGSTTSSMTGCACSSMKSSTRYGVGLLHELARDETRAARVARRWPAHGSFDGARAVSSFASRCRRARAGAPDAAALVRAAAAGSRRGAGSRRVAWRSTFVDDRLAKEAELVVERAHVPPPSACLAARFVVGIGPRSMMPFSAKSRRTVSDGCAPFASHSRAFALVDHDGSRLGARVVVSQDLDEAPVARRARVGDHETIGRLFFCADAAQSNSYHVLRCFRC